MIPASLIDDLRRHVDHFAQPGDDGYVFTGIKGGPLAPHVLQKAWAEARAELGLDEVHLHDLRHLAGTLAAGTGAGTKELIYRLGHSSHEAALRYQHATRERDIAIASGIDGVVLAAAVSVRLAGRPDDGIRVSGWPVRIADADGSDS